VTGGHAAAVEANPAAAARSANVLGRRGSGVRRGARPCVVKLAPREGRAAADGGDCQGDLRELLEAEVLDVGAQRRRPERRLRHRDDRPPRRARRRRRLARAQLLGEQLRALGRRAEPALVEARELQDPGPRVLVVLGDEQQNERPPS